MQKRLPPVRTVKEPICRGRPPGQPARKRCEFTESIEITGNLTAGTSRAPSPTIRNPGFFDTLRLPLYGSLFCIVMYFRIVIYTIAAFPASALCFIIFQISRHFLPPGNTRTPSIDKSAASVKYCTVVSRYFVDIFSAFLLDFNNPKC